MRATDQFISFHPLCNSIQSSLISSGLRKSKLVLQLWGSWVHLVTWLWLNPWLFNHSTFYTYQHSRASRCDVFSSGNTQLIPSNSILFRTKRRHLKHHCIFLPLTLVMPFTYENYNIIAWTAKWISYLVSIAILVPNLITRHNAVLAF